MIGWALTIIIGSLLIAVARSGLKPGLGKDEIDPEVWEDFIGRAEDASERERSKFHDLSEIRDDTRARILAVSWSTVLLTAFSAIGISLISQPEEWMLMVWVTGMLGISLRDDFGDTFVGFMRRALRRQGDVAVYVLAAAVKIALIACGVWLLFRAAAMLNTWSVVGGLGFLLVALVTLVFAHVPSSWLIQFGVLRRRHNAELMVNRDSILLLRSFDDDSARLRTPVGGGGILGTVLPIGIWSLEQLIASGIPARQIVAIGQPGEKLPPLGAVRTYWADDEWQSAIQRAANRCRMIVVFGGASEGLTWELDKVTSWGLLGKTVVFLPPIRGGSPAVRLRHVVDRLSSLSSSGEIQRSSWPAEDTEDERLLGSSTIAVRVTHEGEIRYYVTAQHDWAGYVAALHQFLVEFEGRSLDDADAPRRPLPRIEREPVTDLKRFWVQTRRLAVDEEGLFRDPVDAHRTAMVVLQTLDPQTTPGTAAAIQTLAIRADLQSHPPVDATSPEWITWLRVRYKAAADAANLARHARYGAPVFGSAFSEDFSTVAGGLNMTWTPARVQLEATQTAYAIAEMMSDPGCLLEASETGVAFAAQQEDPIVECTWRLRLIEASLRVDDLRTAEREMAKARELAHRVGDVMSLYQVTRLEIEFHRLRGDERAAEVAHQRSARLRAQLGGEEPDAEDYSCPIPS